MEIPDLTRFNYDLDKEELYKIVSEVLKTKSKTKIKAYLAKKMPKESYYQSKIIKGLSAKYPDAFVRKISLGGYSQAGLPDILFILNGQYFGFEVKRPYGIGDTTAIQEKTMDLIRKAGGYCFVVSFPEQAFDAIDLYLNKTNLPF